MRTSQPVTVLEGVSLREQEVCPSGAIVSQSILHCFPCDGALDTNSPALKHVAIAGVAGRGIDRLEAPVVAASEVEVPGLVRRLHERQRRVARPAGLGRQAVPPRERTLCIGRPAGWNVLEEKVLSRSSRDFLEFDRSRIRLENANT